MLSLAGCNAAHSASQDRHSTGEEDWEYPPFQSLVLLALQRQGGKVVTAAVTQVLQQHCQRLMQRA